ncbi:hypothetical protein POM88_050022 [Heracleum sosnowskyi]|uniref:Uncharacterized protein n=1 Tax=Heracleum sosnowskyi TaxID=360622 RepID=A0AAD8GY03_9APIA|nr:hypothetical protein POM88_050022 [Heracleum sosnowskyi]
MSMHMSEVKVTKCELSLVSVPPSWERYQQKVQEWNQLMAKGNSITSCGSKRKAPPVEKPIMFAFCLKPRDQDRVHTRARRFNSFAVGDEKATNFDVSPENSDNFSMLQTSTSSPEYNR